MNESVHGYKIKQAITFDNDRGFAFAENPKAVQPFVTWQFTNDDGKKECYWGHYSQRKESAVADFEKRVAEYKADYPTLTVTEKYNYLAAAEMSAEDNYNQIDGVPNNTSKPSIIERLREYESQKAGHIADTAEKSGKSAGHER